ncbi:hypothetical protein CFP65_0351 [Kitasatospora sp. MMS16-BH015]|uniref:CDP-glycerol glycerophosphotransferase family protein n=1 Tax=Kitasatospora sp. MMS16-BH015 TaxID=2018025 RepID=UPI000CA10E9B|nr:CDP-glycerol glycerophosphotransferase family protein [Kitasatospora sp. MMS16-BH015]AUG75323.1 hypothetical protein CFP65_0351 [Kitasatospora sp. MMS16-BH015]
MDLSRRILVPVGPEPQRWRTFGSERTLVVAARTVTSLVRVLDVLPALLHDDPRVAVVFAYDPGSAFNAGVLELLGALGCRTLPWAQLPDLEPDLLLSASENLGPLPGDYPVLVLPHGIGFQKLVPDSASSGARLSGVVTEELLTAGRAWLAVSHPEQARQLAASHPRTAGRTVLVGDPCYDRLRASTRWRDRYRAALGVAPEQRLVLLSSTWGTESLIGRHPDLPTDLLAQLPVDEYRVALVLHPNVRAGHGGWQVELMLRSALDAGLTLIDPADGWQQALTAADLLIGDHGSVTLYGAALGRPVLLAAYGPEAVPGTAGHTLSRTAHRLAPAAPLLDQVATALHAHRPDRFAHIADLAFAEPGEALPRLRHLVYRLLGLQPPKSPDRGPRAFPLPPAPTTAVTSHLVTTTAVRTAEGRLAVTVRRLPAVLAPDHQEHGSTYCHLSSDLAEPDTRLSESASVITDSATPHARQDGPARLTRLLADFPGALLAGLATPDGCLVATRDARAITVRAAPDTALDPSLAATAVYACLRVAHPLEPTTEVLLHLGPRTQLLRLSSAGPTNW